MSGGKSNTSTLDSAHQPLLEYQRGAVEGFTVIESPERPKLTITTDRAPVRIGSILSLVLYLLIAAGLFGASLRALHGEAPFVAFIVVSALAVALFVLIAWAAASGLGEQESFEVTPHLLRAYRRTWLREQERDFPRRSLKAIHVVRGVTTVLGDRQFELRIASIDLATGQYLLGRSKGDIDRIAALLAGRLEVPLLYFPASDAPPVKSAQAIAG